MRLGKFWKELQTPKTELSRTELTGHNTFIVTEVPVLSGTNSCVCPDSSLDRL